MPAAPSSPELLRTSSPAAPWQRQWSVPRCQCFELCTSADLVKLYPRLPTAVRNEASPWHTYLTRVYGESGFPLPFDLHRLEIFYPGLLPTSTHLCRGPPLTVTARSVNITEAVPHLPICTQEQCAGWLREQSEVERDPEVMSTYPPGWAGPAAQIWTPLTELWHSDDAQDQHDLRESGANQSRLELTGRHLFVGLQLDRPRTYFDDDTWVEVIRVRQGSYSRLGRPLLEGGYYGCWFWPVRGSGMFVNVGRSLHAVNKAAAALELGTPPHDEYFANATAARGFASLQVRSGAWQYGGSRPRFHGRTAPGFELILTGPGCVVAPEQAAVKDAVGRAAKNLTGPCAPVPLRAGWAASRPCACDNSASPLLNCLGTHR